MIELFDPQRLLPRRDHSLLLAGLVLAAGAGGLAVYASTLQQSLRTETARKTALEGQVRQAQALLKQAPSAALLADLQRELARVESEVAMASGARAAGSNDVALAPSAWLERLAALAQPGVSLSKVDVDAQGNTHVEGMAVNALAVSSFVQAFSRQEALAGLAPRSVELRQDKGSAPHLRFQMRATVPLGVPIKAELAPPMTAANAVQNTVANIVPRPAAPAASSAGGRS